MSNRKTKKPATNKALLEARKQAIQSKEEFENCRAFMNNLRASKNMWQSVDETYITIKGYEQRAGFRLLTQTFTSKETATKFFEAFRKEVEKRFSSVKILSCNIVKASNALEILIASQHIITHETSDVA